MSHLILVIYMVFIVQSVGGEQLKIKFKYDNDSENNYIYYSTEKETKLIINHKYDSNLQLNNTPVLFGTLTHEDTSSVTLDNKSLIITAGSINLSTNRPGLVETHTLLL